MQAIKDYITLSNNTITQNEEQIVSLKKQNNSLSNELDIIRCYLGLKSEKDIIDNLKKINNMQEQLFGFIQQIEELV